MNFSVTKLLVVTLFFAAVGVACKSGGEGNGESRRADSSAPIAGTTVQPDTPVTAPAGVPSAWKSFSTPGLELWLPRSYEGGDPTKGDVDLILSTLRKSGRSDLAATFDTLKDNFLLLMLDNEPGNAGASANVLSTSIPSALSLETVLELNARRLSAAGATISGRSSVRIGSTPAVRLIVDQSSGLDTFRAVQYYFKSGNTLWVVTYGSPQRDFERLLADFDKSANNITIKQ